MSCGLGLWRRTRSATIVLPWSAFCCSTCWPDRASSTVTSSPRYAFVRPTWSVCSWGTAGLAAAAAGDAAATGLLATAGVVCAAGDAATATGDAALATGAAAAGAGVAVTTTTIGRRRRCCRSRRRRHHDDDRGGRRAGRREPTPGRHSQHQRRHQQERPPGASRAAGQHACTRSDAHSRSSAKDGARSSRAPSGSPSHRRQDPERDLSAVSHPERQVAHTMTDVLHCSMDAVREPRVCAARVTRSALPCSR